MMFNCTRTFLFSPLWSQWMKRVFCDHLGKSLLCGHVTNTFDDCLEAATLFLSPPFIICLHLLVFLFCARKLSWVFCPFVLSLIVQVMETLPGMGSQYYCETNNKLGWLTRIVIWTKLSACLGCGPSDIMQNEIACVILSSFKVIYFSTVWKKTETKLLAFCLRNLRDYAGYAGKIQTEYFENILQFIEKQKTWMRRAFESTALFSKNACSRGSLILHCLC